MNGYIEGYYGKILTWENRKRIINKLNMLKMQFYFYAPKEDIKHRKLWRNNYGLKWRQAFKEFTSYSSKKNINIIAGISPGLDFNFEHLHLNKIENNDFEILIKKCRQLLDDGANHIAIMLDDISEKFNYDNQLENSEGFYHALLINKISEKLNRPIYFVPRVYANELICTSTNYLKDLNKNINANIKIFYCGKDIVSKSIKPSDFNLLKNKINNEIIIWDNFYANDYCPRRLFLTPWSGRDKVDNVLVNLTGLIETDLFLLDLIFNCKLNSTKVSAFTKTKLYYNIPNEFTNISKFFGRPYFNNDISYKNIKMNNKTIVSIDHMLWKWKSNLAMEWYPFLMGLKHDLLIYKNTLSQDRIKKTQTNALGNFILKK